MQFCKGYALLITKATGLVKLWGQFQYPRKYVAILVFIST